jgi:hypothetical protein
MKRYILLATAVLFSFASCDLVNQMTGGETPSSPGGGGTNNAGGAGGGGSGDGQGGGSTSVGGVPSYDADDTLGTLRFSFPGGDTQASQSARSMTGPSATDIVSGDYMVNYNEVILVDSEDTTKIWDWNKGVGDVIVKIKKGQTYKILILSGHKPTANESVKWGDVGNTLLSSGYREIKMSANVNYVDITMTPLIVGAEFLDPAAWAAQQTNPNDRSGIIEPERLAVVVGLYSNTEYNVRYSFGSSQTGMGSIDDSMQKVIGNGLLPLYDAQKNVVYSGGQQQYGLRLMENGNELKVTGSKVSRQNDGLDYQDDTKKGRSVRVTGDENTTPTAVYKITAGTATSGAPADKVYMNLKYAPFGLDAFSAWKDTAFSGGAVASGANIPSWIIRSGLNDVGQNPLEIDAGGNITTYGTNFEEYGETASANPNGAITIGVVDAS